MARWQQEKQSIQRQRKLKEELEQLRLEIERVQRGGDYGKASARQRLTEDDVRVRFCHVAGVDEAKLELMEIVEFL